MMGLLFPSKKDLGIEDDGKFDLSKNITKAEYILSNFFEIRFA